MFYFKRFEEYIDNFRCIYINDFWYIIILLYFEYVIYVDN